MPVYFNRAPEGVKWELGFAYFWLGKWDFMHWDCMDGIHRQKTIEKGMELRFEQNSHSDNGICAFRYWDFMEIGPPSGPSFNSIY